MQVKITEAIYIEGAGHFKKDIKEGILTKYVGMDNEEVFYTFHDSVGFTQLIETMFSNEYINIVFASSSLASILKGNDKNATN